MAAFVIGIELPSSETLISLANLFVYRRTSIVYEIRHYLTEDGKDTYLDWQSRLRDTKARIAIDRRINRIELGNFGDHKFVCEGVWELPSM